VQKIKQKINLTVIISLFFIQAKTQQIDSMLNVYKENFQQEKLYIHFDRGIYSSGETVWYKAYLMAGNELSDCSRNFYVDWYDNNGKIIKHTIAPIFESSARGQFDVPANYKGEWLHIKAYTKWMLNFDTAFLYENDIRITQSVSGNNKEIYQPSTSISFFPEGGDLINGITSNVAFLANDKSGKPVSVRGAIVNNKNQLIDSFLSAHDGMGTFALEPHANETYSCNWVDEFGVTYSNPLPAVKNNGIYLSAQQLNDKALVVITRNKEATDNFKTLTVIATIHQQEVYKVKINLSSKQKAIAEIKTKELPTGVLQITVFDADWLPVAERILFVNNQQYEFFPSLNIIAKGLNRREKNIVEIKVADSVLSNMSVSVTDAGLSSTSSNNIFSRLLLTGDIKGYIHNPAYYFSDNSETTKKYLDLVMLTHGWRKYNWSDIIANKTPSFQFAKDSDYLQLKGNVYSVSKTQPIQNITFILQAKDSSKQYLVVPVAANGSFNQRGVIFFDTVRVFYRFAALQSKDADYTKAIKIENGLQTFNYAKTIKNNLPDFIWNNDSAINRAKYLALESEKLQKNYEANKLKEVTVYTKVKSPVELLDEKYTSGLFSTTGNNYSFDVIGDARAQASLDILHYLQSQIPGLSVSLTFLGANGAEDANSSNAPGINWRDGTPDIFLNEMPSDVNTIQSIQMSDVAYIKVFKPPFMAASGSGPSGAIAVYTKKANDASKTVNINSNNTLLQGYTPIKEFYNPNYSIVQTDAPDTRSTIYWNPYVLTDKKNKSVKLEFYNNDISKKFRIVVEGVNALGQITRVEKIIE
jgi:hypothetical protein